MTDLDMRDIIKLVHGMGLRMREAQAPPVQQAGLELLSLTGAMREAWDDERARIDGVADLLAKREQELAER